VTTSPAALHLIRIATLWPCLDDALDTRGAAAWPPAGRMSDYLASIDRHDAEEAAALRALERDPAQLGETRAPLSIRILDTARLVEGTLVHLADTLAPQITEAASTHAPADWPARGWTPADARRRDTTAAFEQGDPARWRYVGLRTTEYAAGWLHARVMGDDGPFRPLDAAQLHHVEQVAAGCAERIEQALDLLGREHAAALPCPRCAGRITVTAGGGRDPQAQCAGACGRVWTLADAVAA
jgi:hypothetical protein